MPRGDSHMLVAKVVRLGALVGLEALAGCSFASNALCPSLGGWQTQTRTAATTPTTTAAPAATQVQATAVPAPPALGATNFVPAPVSQGVNTGTFVGSKVSQHRGEL